MDFAYDYENITLEEIETYRYHEFICDGDSKLVKVKRSDDYE